PPPPAPAPLAPVAPGGQGLAELDDPPAIDLHPALLDEPARFRGRGDDTRILQDSPDRSWGLGRGEHRPGDGVPVVVQEVREVAVERPLPGLRGLAGGRGSVDEPWH